MPIQPAPRVLRTAWLLALAPGLGCGCEQPKLRCTPECVADATECVSSGSIRVCRREGDGCIRWSAETACLAGQECRDGSCVPLACIEPPQCGDGARCAGGICVPCPGCVGCTWACRSGDRLCAQAASYLECVVPADGCPAWSQPRSCPAASRCVDGQCVTCPDACAEGARRCSAAGVPEACRSESDGCTRFEAASPCPAGELCRAGACVTPCGDGCTLGATRCQNGLTEVCLGRTAGTNTCPTWGPSDRCPVLSPCELGIPACASPGIVGEHQVSPNTWYQAFSRLAWSGTQFGLVWVDGRDQVGGGGLELYFARLDASGAKIGSELRLTTAPGSSEFPAIGWSGGGWGVAWQDTRDFNHEIYFQLVSVTGQAAAPSVRVTQDAARSLVPAIVWTGAEWGLAWADDRDGNLEVYFNRIDVTGRKLGPDRRITNTPADSASPGDRHPVGIVYDGSGFAVTWEEERSAIWLARLDATGAVQWSREVRASSRGGLAIDPTLECEGTSLSVAFSDSRAAAPGPGIYFARTPLAAGGTVTLVPPTGGQLDEVGPALALAGTGYGIAWMKLLAQDGWEVFFRRLDLQGAPLGTDLRLNNAPNNTQFPALAFTGRRFGVSYDDMRAGTQNVYGVVVCP